MMGKYRDYSPIVRKVFGIYSVFFYSLLNFARKIRSAIRRMDIEIGDKLTMKKPHPCGSKEFTVLRSGMDFRLKCCGCGHEFMVARAKAEKHIRRIDTKWRNNINAAKTENS